MATAYRWKVGFFCLKKPVWTSPSYLSCRKVQTVLNCFFWKSDSISLKKIMKIDLATNRLLAAWESVKFGTETQTFLLCSSSDQHSNGAVYTTMYFTETEAFLYAV